MFIYFVIGVIGMTLVMYRYMITVDYLITYTVGLNKNLYVSAVIQ